jgi:hypothetical protein
MTAPMTYEHKLCYLNAYVNRLYYYKGKNLKMVIGALSINNQFGFGHKDWTKEDYLQTIRGTNSDSHCWLEDDEGNVYDYLFEQYKWWAEKKKQPMKRSGLLECVSKEELVADGIEYIPASQETQLALYLNVCEILSRMAINKAKRWGVYVNPFDLFD